MFKFDFLITWKAHQIVELFISNIILDIEGKRLGIVYKFIKKSSLYFLSTKGSIHSWGTKQGKNNLRTFIELLFTNNIYMKQT
jgi:hypothetical protein